LFHGLTAQLRHTPLKQGTDIRYIQELLGHKDLKATLIYTKITNQSVQKVVSPLDNLIVAHFVLSNFIFMS